MFSHVVEIVARNKLALQFLTRIAESARSLAACRSGREHLLLSAPPCRQTVADTRVFVDVEALIVIAIVNGW